MANIIYYFSGTGNSYAIAREIAQNVPDTQLKSIRSSLIGGTKIEKFERVGFVFPVYAWGMPRIVSDFLESAEFIQNDYTYAVVTAGGVIGSTLKELKKVLLNKGAVLDAGFGVRSPSYGFDPDAEPIGLIKFIQFLAGKKIHEIEDFDSRKETIIKAVVSKEKTKTESTNLLADAFGNFLHPYALEAFKKEDRNYYQTENCNQCATCVAICPRDNILINNGSVEWMGNCEGCMACVKWCPQNAIGYKGITNLSNSKNSSVTLKEMVPDE